jgi:hypothetical protein
MKRRAEAPAGRHKETIMTTPSRLMTVDQAAALLGLSRHDIIAMIGTGKVTWTLASDKRTVLVEIPAVRAAVLGEGRACVTTREAVQTAASTTKADAARATKPQRRVRLALSAVDAWSQPK